MHEILFLSHQLQNISEERRFEVMYEKLILMKST